MVRSIIKNVWDLRSKVRTCLLAFLVFSIMMAWTLAGWPRLSLISFPQEIQQARAAATRLYLQNASASYTPTTIKGVWDDSTTSTVAKKLDASKAGSSAISAVDEVERTLNWDVLVARFISEPLQSNTSFTTSDTVQWVIGVVESNASAAMVFHMHIYVTQGDTDSVRGTLLGDSIGVQGWDDVNAMGTGEGTKTLSAVSAQAGDRIVAEVGYQAQNNRRNAYTGTVYYGATGVDLSIGHTDVTNRPGWIEFSNSFSLAGTTTLTSGTDPADSTVDPGDTGVYLDQFTFTTNSGTDSVTALEVTTTNTDAIDSVQIWNNAMTTQYYATVSSPSGDIWSFSGGTPIPVSSSTAFFRVIFAAKPAEAPPDGILGGTYAVTGTVTSYTCSNDKLGSDFHSATITVNNPVIVSFTIIDNGATGLNFSALDNPVTDQPEVAQNSTTGAVTLQVSSDTNIPINIQIMGNSISDGSGHTISVDNVKYNSSDTASGAGTLTGSYVTWYSVPAYTANTVQCYHWITIPSGQTGGNYTSTFYYQAVPQ